MSVHTARGPNFDDDSHGYDLDCIVYLSRRSNLGAQSASSPMHLLLTCPETNILVDMRRVNPSAVAPPPKGPVCNKPQIVFKQNLMDACTYNLNLSTAMRLCDGPASRRSLDLVGWTLSHYGGLRTFAPSTHHGLPLKQAPNTNLCHWCE